MQYQHISSDVPLAIEPDQNTFLALAASRVSLLGSTPLTLKINVLVDEINLSTPNKQYMMYSEGASQLLRCS